MYINVELSHRVEPSTVPDHWDIRSTVGSKEYHEGPRDSEMDKERQAGRLAGKNAAGRHIYVVKLCGKGPKADN